jgi:hypothetical protein
MLTYAEGNANKASTTSGKTSNTSINAKDKS